MVGFISITDAILAVFWMMVGGTLGALAMAVAAASKWEDDRAEYDRMKYAFDESTRAWNEDRDQSFSLGYAAGLLVAAQGRGNPEYDGYPHAPYGSGS